MIFLKQVKPEDYRICTSCGKTPEEAFVVTIGGTHTFTHYLCKDCLRNLNKETDRVMNMKDFFSKVVETVEGKK